jgi:hypothetical protein
MTASVIESIDLGEEFPMFHFIRRYDNTIQKSAKAL